MSKETGAVDCICPGMGLFKPLDKAKLLKSPNPDSIVLPYSMPAGSKELAERMNGYRDESYAKAQTASIALEAAKTKCTDLPSTAQKNPAVQQSLADIQSAQDGLNEQLAKTEAARTQLLGAQSELDSQYSEALRGARTSILETADQKTGMTGKMDAMREKMAKVEEKTQPAREKMEKAKSRFSDSKAKLSDKSSKVTSVAQTAFGHAVTAYTLYQMAPSSTIAPTGSGDMTFAVPRNSEDALNTMQSSLGLSDCQEMLNALRNFQFPEMPAMPPFPALPGIPSLSIPPLPALPAFPGLPAMPPIAFPFDLNFLSMIKMPGLPAIPELPALPAFPAIPPLPELPPFQLDLSILKSLMPPFDLSALLDALSFSFLPDFGPLKDMLNFPIPDLKSFLDKDFWTSFLPEFPGMPAMPELPAFPSLNDASELLNIQFQIPTLCNLVKNYASFPPNYAMLAMAAWTQIHGRFAVAQRAQDAVKMRTAGAHVAAMSLMESQKAALAEKIPLQQYLDRESGKNAAANALAQKRQLFLEAIPETPLKCSRNCKNAANRSLFPDVSSPEQMDAANFFSNPALPTTPGLSMVTVGDSAKSFTSGHMDRLKSSVSEAGGNVVDISSFDLELAAKDPLQMLNLEDRLRENASMVNMSELDGLSPRATALMKDISDKMSPDVPVLCSTSSIANLSLDPAVNSAAITNLCPGGSALDTRTVGEFQESMTTKVPPLPETGGLPESSGSMKSVFDKFKR